MAGKSEKKQVILFGIRSTGDYGDAVVPTKAILCSNISHNPLAGSTVSRDNYKGFLGSTGTQRATAYQEVSFDVEFAASGTEGDEPAYNELLRATAMAETIDAGVDVEYTPIDSSFEDGTLYYYVEDVLHKIDGALGTVEMDLSLGQIAKYKFKFIGLYRDAAEASPGALDFSAFTTPIIPTSQSVKTLSFFGQTDLQANTIMINPGVSIVHTDLTNQEVVEITDREGTVSLKFREPDVSTIDFFKKAKDGASGALTYQLGDDSVIGGSCIKVEVPNIQIDSCTRSFENNKSMLTVTGTIVPITANSDWTITYL